MRREGGSDERSVATADCTSGAWWWRTGRRHARRARSSSQKSNAVRGIGEHGKKARAVLAEAVDAVGRARGGGFDELSAVGAVAGPTPLVGRFRGRGRREAS